MNTLRDQTIAVLSGGMMDVSIPLNLLGAGYACVLIEPDAEAVDRAQHAFAKALKDSDHATRLTISTDVAAANDCSLVIVSTGQDGVALTRTLTRLSPHLGANATVALNAAFVDPSDYADAVPQPDHLVALSFAEPANRMRLVEIVASNTAAPDSVDRVADLVGQLGKVPVTVCASDGLICNRLLSRAIAAIDRLLLVGATPWELDDALKEFGFSPGLLELFDMAGLDVFYADRRRRNAPLLVSDRMVEEGRLGRKTVVGWYRYPGNGGAVIDPLMEDMAVEEAHFARIPRQSLTDAQIVDGVVLAMVDEAAQILVEGVACDPSDIDLVSVHGFGFPAERGGVLSYAQGIGGEAVQNRLKDLEKLGSVWAMSPALAEMQKNAQG